MLKNRWKISPPIFFGSSRKFLQGSGTITVALDDMIISVYSAIQRVNVPDTVFYCRNISPKNAI